jgi:hypothetical protein
MSYNSGRMEYYYDTIMQSNKKNNIFFLCFPQHKNKVLKFYFVHLTFYKFVLIAYDR